MLEKLEAIHARYKEIELLLSSPEVVSDMKRYKALNKEYKNLEGLENSYKEYKSITNDLASAKELIKVEKDKETRDFFKSEIVAMEARIPELNEQIRLQLLPRDPEDDKPAVVEIRSGTGGDEAAIFAGDLYRMYMRFCDNKGWKTDLIDAVESTKGGFSRISFEINEPGAYGVLTCTGSMNEPAMKCVTTCRAPDQPPSNCMYCTNGRLGSATSIVGKRDTRPSKGSTRIVSPQV